MVTITLEEYEELIEDSEVLRFLRKAGVDNWEGYSYAFELRREASERELGFNKEKAQN